MAQKTFLQLVNKVQLNLRESQTTDLSSAYAQLLGEYVNQAKEQVEDSWRWRALTTTIGFTTVDHQQAYALTSTASPAATSSNSRFPDERSYVLKDSKNNDSAFDITQIASNVIYQLRKVPREDNVGDIYLGPARSTSQPYTFSYSVESGTPTIYLTDPPPVSRVLAFRMCIAQTELVNTTDTLLIPWRPVVSLATFFAMQERGEELGQTADLYMSRYNAELARDQDTDRDGSYDQLLVDTGSGASGGIFG